MSGHEKTVFRCFGTKWNMKRDKQKKRDFIKNEVLTLGIIRSRTGDEQAERLFIYAKVPE